MRREPRKVYRMRRWIALAIPLLLAGCGQTGSLTDNRETIIDRDLSAIALPGTASQLRPVERVPRSTFAVVNPAPLGERDTPAFVYPSLDQEERESLLEGLQFFTTLHEASRGVGPAANQRRCMGCHLSGDDNQPGTGILTTSSHITRAARATPTNFRYTAFDPSTGGGRAADNLDALTNTGRTAAFTIFGDFLPAAGVFEPLAQFNGFVQHTRPTLPGCLPDPIIPINVDPNLRGGVDPLTGISALGFRRTTGERAGPPYIGRGLMEAIPSEDLVLNDDPTDARDSNSSLRAIAPRFPECPGDCISGRHNENASSLFFIGGDPVVRVGRFGLRGAGPTILQFITGGIQGELGFTTELTPTEINDELNVGRPGCIDSVPEPEINVTAVISCRQLVRLTAPPEFGDPLLAVLRASDPNAPRGGQEGLVQRGAQLFGIDLVAFANRMIAGRMPSGGDGRDRYAINQADRGVGCAGCHTPVHTTGESPSRVGGRHLSNVWAPIFSDLLLHEQAEVTPERIASTVREPILVVRNGFNTLDLSRNLTDDTLPGQGVANGKEFRTPPLMGIGRVGPPFMHDARIFLSKDTRDTFPLGTVYSDATVTNAPLVVRSFDDALRAAIEVHDLPPPDDDRTPAVAGAGCPVPASRFAGPNVRYSGHGDVCPPYDTAVSRANRSEAREVIRRFRSLGASDQQAIIEFLKQL